MNQLEKKVIDYCQGIDIEKETSQQQEAKKDRTTQTENTASQNQLETVIDLDEHFEANQSLNNSQANLLNKSQKEEIELEQIQSEQQAQIVQAEPFGMPSSSKPK